jgi:putative selenate reductase
MEVIIDKNPLPHLTGYICDHECENHCTRWDYEDPIHIREIKKEAVLNGFDDFIKDYKFTPEINPDFPKIAVIGAGSAGLSAAYYLAKSNFDVTLFDKENVSGGVAKTAVPDFRLPPEAMEKDIKFIEKHGVRFVFGTKTDFSIDQLQEEGFKHICVCTGAAKSNKLSLEGEYQNYSEAINFLEKYVQKESINLGKNVGVIGAGNSAMDAARSALRCENVENVYLIYRRTKEFMPAYLEEFEETIEDGVIYKELLMPVQFDDKILKCQKMELSDYGSDGRRNIRAVADEFIDLEIDYVISAIGETIDSDVLVTNGIDFDNGYPKLNPDTLESNLENVYLGGDVYRGPSSFVQAIADGRTIAETIIGKENGRKIDEINMKAYFVNKDVEERTDNINGEILKQEHSDMQVESSRCLACNFVCNKCVDVCPNRSNVAVKSEQDIFKDSFQILHVDGMCNDCGNCETFCPFNGLPYRDKITLFWSEEEFLESPHDGFYRISRSSVSSKFKIRVNNHVQEIELDTDNNPIDRNILLDQKFMTVLKNTLENYEYLFND